MYNEEQKIQEAVVNYLKSKHPDVLFTIAPAGARRGTKLQRIIAGRDAKRMGYCKGTSDLFIIKRSKSFSGLFLELKTEKGKISDEQKIFMEKASKEGFCCLVGYGYTDALKQIQSYLS